MGDLNTEGAGAPSATRAMSYTLNTNRARAAIVHPSRANTPSVRAPDPDRWGGGWRVRHQGGSAAHDILLQSGRYGWGYPMPTNVALPPGVIGEGAGRGPPRRYGGGERYPGGTANGEPWTSTS